MVSAKSERIATVFRLRRGLLINMRHLLRKRILIKAYQRLFMQMLNLNSYLYGMVFS